MSRERRLDTNVPGDLYVNAACINCDTCRQLAPDVFAEVVHYSAVVQQPKDSAERRQAMHALLACPTAAIVSESKEDIADASADFPLPLDGPVSYCGYTARHSFGGSSYFITHPDGNWMIDAPRFIPSLARRLETLGGIRYIFLTHRDDVADADKYAAHFRAERIIHRQEQSAQPDAEHFIEGNAPLDWHPDFRIIPTPGHTRGHMALLHANRYLFTGDHLAWDRESRHLEGNRDYCWHSWEEQRHSFERLLSERFEWVLPGHGERVRLPEDEMKKHLRILLQED